MDFEKKMARLHERANRENGGSHVSPHDATVQIVPLPVTNPGGEKTKRGSMPSRIKIVQYWLDKGTFAHLYKGEPGCFACGGESGGITSDAAIETRWIACSLDRAHLIPSAEGGSNDVSNLVLLCTRCHREAPNVGSSARPMIDWINRREGYVIHAWRRICEECNAIDPGLIQRVARSAWNGQGETLEIRTKDFLAKTDMMRKHLRIGMHPGGDTFATVAAIIGAMGELAVPATTLATNPAGELRIGIEAWIAKQERERISERGRSGIAVARAKGKQIGRPVKVWRRDDAVELRAQGMSLRQIATRIGQSEATIRRALKVSVRESPPALISRGDRDEGLFY